MLPGEMVLVVNLNNGPASRPISSKPRPAPAPSASTARPPAWARSATRFTSSPTPTSTPTSAPPSTPSSSTWTPPTGRSPHERPRPPVDPRVLAPPSRRLSLRMSLRDITTSACVPPDMTACGSIVAREPGVVSGIYVCREVFASSTHPSPSRPPSRGRRLRPDTAVARVDGLARPILTGERVALNFLQRLCGIATLTRTYAEALAGTSCRLLDTRKTTPGLRAFEKAAVRAGGGGNHRFALYDGFLIKDNHIAAAAALPPRSRPPAPSPPRPLRSRSRSSPSPNSTTPRRLRRCDHARHFTPEQVSEAVRRLTAAPGPRPRAGSAWTPSAPTPEAGVDFISVGRLTHSAPTIDLNLELAAHVRA